MSEPILKTYGNVFVLQCDYHDRHIPKEANFRWHTDKCNYKDCAACAEGLEKGWWTADDNAAAGLIDYATPEAQLRLGALAIDKERRYEASHAKAAGIDIPAPEGLEYLPYQRAGVQYAVECWRRGVGALIGDEMGLGKTIQAIGAINLNGDIRRILIICPAAVKINWKRELEKWMIDMRYTPALADSKFWPMSAEIVITNYEILEKHHQNLRQRPWDLIIIDEAHYIKNKKARRSKEVYGGKIKIAGGDVKLKPIPTRYKLLLTGTPIENEPKEIYRLANYCDPGLWPNEWNFLNTYYIPQNESYYVRGGGGTKATATKFEQTRNLDHLGRKLRENIMIRRKKVDVLPDLPDKRRQIIELQPATKMLAGRIRDELEKFKLMTGLREQLENAKRLATEHSGDASYRTEIARIGAELEKAEEHVAVIRRENGIAKVPYVINHLEDAIASSGKVVCFGFHREVLERFYKHFEGDAVLYYGGMPDHKKQDAIDAFQSPIGPKLFVGSIVAAGVGITLTASHHQVFAEIDWVPGRLDQAEGRCHRYGQVWPVLIQHLIFENSIDAYMFGRIGRKMDTIEEVLEQ